MYRTWTYKTRTTRSALYHTARILWLIHLYIVLSKPLYRYPNSGKSPITGSLLRVGALLYINRCGAH